MSKKVPIIAIVGRANVGKSSLFNAILNRREAIVAREPGTTRDSITAKAHHGGSDFWLVDTAGVKDPEDEFEYTIQEQIVQAADSADIIWVVVEAITQITEEDRRVAKLALKSRKPVILIVNKIDRAQHADLAEYQRLGIKPIFATSTTQKTGIDELLDDIVALIPKATIPEDDNRLNIALLGRPNVGKSALFNSLAKKQQALVADKAGTTRDVNRTSVRYERRDVHLMDTAGIRRSGKIEKGIERFSVIRALSAIEQADVCLLLIDVNELSVQLDQKIAGMIKEAGKGLILVVSKWDSLEEKTPYTRDQIAPRIQAEFDFVPWAPLVFTSSITGQNVTKIFELAMDIDKERHKRISTGELNRWLQTVIDSHPPAGLRNRQPKLNYIVQEDDNPIPSFKIFGSHTRFVHWSYRRYIERSLREKFGYAGTAVQLWFIEKHSGREGSREGYKPSSKKVRSETRKLQTRTRE
jgi:GTP-binding protein